MPRQVVAVGSSAHHALKKWSIPHQLVRHPSHGGKKAFVTSMDEIQSRIK